MKKNNFHNYIKSKLLFGALIIIPFTGKSQNYPNPNGDVPCSDGFAVCGPNLVTNGDFEQGNVVA